MRTPLLLLLGLTSLTTAGCAPTCEPVGPPYCEGDVLRVCAGEDGAKGVIEETDCAASGQVCAMNHREASTPAAACRPAECEEGWACFSDNVGERMCDLAGENVFTCVDEGAGCFGWEFVEECAALGPDLSCVELDTPNDATCQ